MNIKKYQEFAHYLRTIVEDEREQCVIDKNLLLTAAAAIDELSCRVAMTPARLQINKVTMMSSTPRVTARKHLHPAVLK